MEGFFIVTLIAVCWAAHWFFNHRPSTDRRGSRYYVPKFQATFDAWSPKWSGPHRRYVNRDHVEWQKEFDRLESTPPGRGPTGDERGLARLAGGEGGSAPGGSELLDAAARKEGVAGVASQEPPAGRKS
jgi:hypothetical protein